MAGLMATFDSNGLQIHYEVFGEGRPLVLVHGFASSLAGNWLRTGWVEALKPIRKVVALDCRGHGESGKPHESEAYADDAMANDVIALMDELEIEQTDIFGYSMGGGVSIRLLLTRPERITAGIFGGIGDRLARQSRRTNMPEAMLAEDTSKIADPVAKGFRIFAEAGGNDLKALAAYQSAARAGIDTSKLSQVRVPVLFVIGGNDALVGDPATLVDAIPGARLVRIPDKDHLTVVPDRRFKDAVVQFLGEVAEN